MLEKNLKLYTPFDQCKLEKRPEKIHEFLEYNTTLMELQLTTKLCLSKMKSNGVYELEIQPRKNDINSLSTAQFVFKVLEESRVCGWGAYAEQCISYVGGDLPLPKTLEPPMINNGEIKFKSFAPDIYVKELEGKTYAEIAPTYGLVLVAFWQPAPEDPRTPLFKRLMKRVRDSMDEIPVLQSSRSLPSSKSSDYAYFYPIEHLHVTIATFHRFMKPLPDVTEGYRDPDITPQSDIESLWNNVLITARKLPSWPETNFLFKVVDIKLNEKAGILLYEELTGNLQKIRNAIEKVCMSKEQQGKFGYFKADQPMVPNIIHTTFLRWKDDCDLIDAHRVIKNWDTSKKKEILISCWPKIGMDGGGVKLVREMRPYMHVPHDEHHVIYQF